MSISSPKRMKSEIKTDSCDNEPMEDRGWTPFDTLDNWDGNILDIINDYLPADEGNGTLRQTHLHWFVVHKLSTDYSTAIKHAVREGNLTSVKYLADKVTEYTVHGAVVQSSRLGDIVILLHLLSVYDWTYTALQTAAYYGHMNIVRRLVSTHGTTTNALSLAYAGGQVEIVKYLLSVDTDVTERTREAVISAA